ncbi:hypothetical protein [Nocardia jiangsuensis]|uniref:Uncharacterized protein n=1 Tax=Nocardia jiangsuensis TaxID=1691563 RepID=A0ABV8DWZ6_9NOCA
MGENSPESDDRSRVRAVLEQISSSETRGTAFTVAADIERFLAADWPERAELLRTDGELLDPVVVRILRDRNLAAALFVERAVVAGVRTAVLESGILIELEAAVASRSPQRLRDVPVRFAEEARAGTGSGLCRS